MNDKDLTARLKELDMCLEILEPKKKNRGTAYRRMMWKKKNTRLYKIVTSSFVPFVGTTNGHYDADGELIHGCYVKKCGRSGIKRFAKRESRRRVRKCDWLSGKSNRYRRVFDYWWTLY